MCDLDYNFFAKAVLTVLRVFVTGRVVSRVVGRLQRCLSDIEAQWFKNPSVSSLPTDTLVDQTILS
jgi:hypothetical protein